MKKAARCIFLGKINVWSRRGHKAGPVNIKRKDGFGKKWLSLFG